MKEIETFIKGNELIFDRENEALVDLRGHTILKIEGWMRLQDLFRRRNDSVDWTKAEKFTLDMGFFFRDTINSRLKGNSFTREEIVEQLMECDTLSEAIKKFKE